MLKRLFSTDINTPYAALALLVVRIGVAALMLSHGLPKFGKLFAEEPVKFADPIGVGEVPSLVLTVFAEVLCSIFIMIGLGTRLASIPPLITMLVAALVVHAGDPLGKKEAALIYFLLYLVLLVFGSGKYSADRMIFKPRNAETEETKR